MCFYPGFSAYISQKESVLGRKAVKLRKKCFEIPREDEEEGRCTRCRESGYKNDEKKKKKNIWIISSAAWNVQYWAATDINHHAMIVILCYRSRQANFLTIKRKMLMYQKHMVAGKAYVRMKLSIFLREWWLTPHFLILSDYKEIAV